jgi:hypothetical protein
MLFFFDFLIFAALATWLVKWVGRLFFRQKGRRADPFPTRPRDPNMIETEFVDEPEDRANDKP